MTTYKSFNDLVLDMLDYLRLTQPSLDVKPNSVARDLFVDAQSLQLATLYDNLREIAEMQSISNITGQDLTNYGSNFSITRNSGTKSAGTVVFTFRSINEDITISSGSVVRTRTGIPFVTVSTVTALASQKNALKATATRLRQYLDIANITDIYALEVSVEAQSTGSTGNVSKFSVITHNVSGVTNVTNLVAFTGGTDQEDDASFRARILATFAGTNVGTALGYRSIILNLVDAIDALVIEPGDPLMTRDGSVVINSSGELVVSEPGTGGKVDIYVMGENSQSGLDSFVYTDQSGKDDPTDSENDFILGQSSLTASTSLTINSRRVATLSGTAELPLQPISRIVSVSGSLSGPNFVEQYLNSVGNLQGNYKLTKDTGIAGGSSFGLDKFSWTSSYIALEDESVTKGTFNGIDGLSFTDVLKIPGIRREIQIINENSTVSGSSRNYVTTLHSPVVTVTRVYNLTTGERYVIADQNPDSTGDLNTTGRIRITGRTLPTASDILQVDYLWSFEFDPYIDFDNLDPQDPLNVAQDSIEWGFSNYIRDESITVNLDAYNNLIAEMQFPITRVLSINTYVSETATVQLFGTTGKTIQVSKTISNIHSIKDSSLLGSPEVFNTKIDDGNFSNKLITLPSDTLAQTGDQIQIIYNLDDIYTSDGYTGLVLNNQVTILPFNIIPSGTSVLANYVAAFRNLLPITNIVDLPISTDGFNSFLDVDGYQPVQNIYSGSTITSNKRRSPTLLRVTTSNLPSEGTIRIVGTTFNKITGVFSATADTTINLSTAIRNAKNISTIPSSIYIAKVLSVEEVTLTASGDVKSVDLEYDITNYQIKNGKWDRAYAIENTSLNNTQILLASTPINVANPITTGTILRVVFYYANENDYEDIFFSKNGTAYTDKVFAHISSINRLSGMQDSAGTISGKILIDSFNQPLINNSYLVDYNYSAPKTNERITINFEYNKLINDAAEAIEDGRPITADVLVKAAEKVELDVEASIIVSSAYSENSSTVQQDVADNITATLSADSLGTTLDSSDIINSIYNVDGVDRVRITRFNKTNVSGTKLSITALNNQYLAPGTVTVTIEER